ncbi:MAG: sugar ABC transporter permease [bacterium]|nr:sugar ABC transporter permease [bacterium]
MKSENAWGYAFIMPLLLMMLVFSIGPILFAFYMSLTDWKLSGSGVFIGLDNFRELFRDLTVQTEIKNSLIFTFFKVPIGVAISMVLAYLLNEKLPFKGMFRVIYFLPSITMAVAVGLVWRYLFNSQYGIVNDILSWFSIQGPYWMADTKYFFAAIILVAIWQGVGYDMIILLAGLQNVPMMYYEAARVEGASSLQCFLKITIPLVTPSLFFVIIMEFMNSLKVFDLIYIFINNAFGPMEQAARTMVYGIYQKAFVYSRMGYASAEAMILFAIILLVTLFQFWGERKWVYYE